MAEANSDETVELRGTPRAAVARAAEPAATITVDVALEVADEARAFATDFREDDRYALVREIARGGGGRIAIAIDRKLGRKVALKRALDQDGESRLEREAIVLAHLEHPAIVPMHDAGHDADGAPYFTMKLVDGGNLADRIAATATFEERLALLPAVTTVADAIAYAHGRRVIHRDLKPGNVLVGSFGEVAVIDWGLGKVLEPDNADNNAEPAAAARHDTPPAGPRLTAHGSVVGTPAYMAPEQATGDGVDERADVYALGAMVYHVLTGSMPFGDLDGETTVARLIAGPPPRVDEREPRVPGDLAAIVGKAMAREPARRYASAVELADDLHRYQTGRLVAAHRYRLWTRAWRAARRHQGKIAIGIGACAIAVAVFAVARVKKPTPACVDTDAPVVAVWNPQVRARGESAFAATAATGAATAWRSVAAALDAQADRITAMRAEACSATRVVRVQSEAILEARVACLDRRLSELRSVATIAEHAERGTVERAPSLADALGRVDDCADVARLRDVAPLPADTNKRAEIAAVETELDRLAALDAAGRSDAWRAQAAALADRATKTGYDPVIARATERRARALLAAQRLDAGAEQLLAASVAADRAHDDATRARALDELGRLEANERVRVAIARPLYAQAAAAAARARDPALSSRIAVDDARLAGKPADAIAAAEKALAAAPASLEARRALADVYVDAGKLDDAERVANETLAQLRAAIGSEDGPDIAAAYGVLARAAWKRSAIDRAIELTDRELAIDGRLQAPDRGAWLRARERRALLDDAAGRYKEAFAALDTLLGEIDKLPPADDDPQNFANKTSKLAISIDMDLGRVAEHAGHDDGAIEAYQDAQGRGEAGNSSLPEYAGSILARAEIYLREKKPDVALKHARAALTLEMARVGRTAPTTAYARYTVARAFLATGDATSAASEAGQAIAAADRGDDPLIRGRYRVLYAKAVAASGSATDARKIVASAHTWLAKAGAAGAADLEELAAIERSLAGK